MDIEQLKIFLAVAEHGGFTKAASALYISHSTTSRGVSALEENLGVKLFDRDSRNVRLTAAGELLYQEGRELLLAAEKLEERVKSAGKGYLGKLTVASVSLHLQELETAGREFCSRYPEVVLGAYHKGLSDIVFQVKKDEADLGVIFSYGLPRDMSDFETRLVKKERFCVVVSLGAAPVMGKTVTVSELREVNYVTVGDQRSGFTRRLEEPILCERPKNEILSVPSLESLFLQVRSGNGVSLVPYPIACEFGADCAILDIEDIETSFDVVMFWKKENENPSLPIFVDLVMQSVTEA